jgi:hypothetical protein
LRWTARKWGEILFLHKHYIEPDFAVPGFVLLKLCYLYHLQFTKAAIVDLKPPNLYTYRVWRQEFALGGQKMGEILFLRE